jgi:transposase
VRFLGDEQKRLEFARAHKDDDVNTLLFSDEHYATCNDCGHGWQWVEAGKHPDHRCEDRFTPKIHVWGVIGVGVKRLVILPGNVNQEVYVEYCIKRNVDLFGGKVLMQDGASSHTAQWTLDELARLKVSVMPRWPPRSPDLNPIEQVWSVLNQVVNDMCPTDAQELEAAVVAAWNSISQEYIDKLVKTFTSKLTKCIALRGRTLP